MKSGPLNLWWNQLRGDFLVLEGSVTKRINTNKCWHSPKEIDIKIIVFKLKLDIVFNIKNYCIQ